MNTSRFIKCLVCIILTTISVQLFSQVESQSTEGSHGVALDIQTIKAIAKEIMNTDYKNWNIVTAKKEIFKGDDVDELVVYKIEVSKGNRIHYLFFIADGTLIKDMKVQS